MTKRLGIELAQTAADAQARLEEEELDLPPRPRYRDDSGIPHLPTNLAELDDDALMELFVKLTRWTDYLSGQVALAEIEERSTESVVTTAEATVMLRDWTGDKEDRVTIARAQRDMDPEVIEWRQKYAEAHAYKKLLLVRYQSAERDAAVVSRELTRRVGRRESNERRADRWGGGK